jgi:hypothetical protein
VEQETYAEGLRQTRALLSPDRFKAAWEEAYTQRSSDIVRDALALRWPLSASDR